MLADRTTVIPMKTCFRRGRRSLGDEGLADNEVSRLFKIFVKGVEPGTTGDERNGMLARRLGLCRVSELMDTLPYHTSRALKPKHSNKYQITCINTLQCNYGPRRISCWLYHFGEKACCVGRVVCFPRLPDAYRKS